MKLSPIVLAIEYRIIKTDIIPSINFVINKKSGKKAKMGIAGCLTAGSLLVEYVMHLKHRHRDFDCLLNCSLSSTISYIEFSCMNIASPLNIPYSTLNNGNFWVTFPRES